MRRDTNVAVSATSRLALALDVNYVTNEISANADSSSLQGLGAYARYQMTDATAVSVRYERLDDEGLFGGVDLRRGQSTALVSGVWWFGNKQGAW